ncbi:MAG: hypothetical protein HYX75_19980 [Acidobacteria bacterium]|nr:hypothetical protein [Acidobacteriota bacterium]
MAGRYLVASVDSGNEVSEGNENNNTVPAKIPQ